MRVRILSSMGAGAKSATESHVCMYVPPTTMHWKEKGCRFHGKGAWSAVLAELFVRSGLLSGETPGATSGFVTASDSKTRVTLLENSITQDAADFGGIDIGNCT